MLKKIRKIKKRYLVLGAIILFILISFIIKKTKPTRYDEFTVGYNDIADTLVLAGVIDVDRRVDLGFAQSGRVEKIYKETGDVVKKGDTIAILSQNKLQADLIEAQANYTATRVNSSSDEIDARSHLEKTIAEQNAIVENLYQEYLGGDLQIYVKNKISQETEPPVLTGNYFGQDEGYYVVDVDPAGNSFRMFGLESGNSLLKTEHPTKLGSQGLYLQFVDGEQYNDTQWIIPIPNTRSSTYLSRKKAYETAVATRDRLVQEAQNDFNRIADVDNDSSISLSEAERKQAQAQVQAIYSQLGDGKVIAPFDGIVAKNNLELGEIVSAYSPLVTVVNSLDKELVLNVPEIYINKIKENDQVEIILDAYKDEVFSGTITHVDIIDTLVDGVPVYQTTVSLNETDDRIRIGMNARARIVTESKQSVLAIPAHFVNSDEQGSFVYIQSGKNPERRSVETGILGSNGMIEIVSGVAEAERVVAEQE